MIRRFRQCLRKHRYQSAEEAAERAQNLSLELGEPIVSYACEYCGRWHIGHPIKAAKPRPPREGPSCSYCGGVIPAPRVEHAAKHNMPLLTCSHRCARRRRMTIAHDRRRAKRRSKPPAQKGQ
jgi:hypothetical protein